MPHYSLAPCSPDRSSKRCSARNSGAENWTGSMDLERSNGDTHIGRGQPGASTPSGDPKLADAMAEEQAQTAE